jgi:hypothetical protein
MGKKKRMKIYEERRKIQKKKKRIRNEAKKRDKKCTIHFMSPPLLSRKPSLLVSV